MKTNPHQPKNSSYLTFALDEEIYAINAGNVLHILEMVKITKVPKTPSYILGVINLRGLVLPVIDMRIKFEMQPKAVTTNTCILVLEVKTGKIELEIGAVVDEVKEVLEISENEIKPPPSIGDKYQAAFLNGVAVNNDDFIMIIETDKILSSKELSSLNKVSKTKEKLETVKD